jgi:hypothetical protein
MRSTNTSFSSRVHWHVVNEEMACLAAENVASAFQNSQPHWAKDSNNFVTLETVWRELFFSVHLRTRELLRAACRNSATRFILLTCAHSEFSQHKLCMSIEIVETISNRWMLLIEIKQSRDKLQSLSTRWSVRLELPPDDVPLLYRKISAISQSKFDQNRRSMNTWCDIPVQEC